jgi:4-hydroxy-tetrahydrodipicolinate synthase
MQSQKFKGVFPYLVSPVDSNGRVKNKGLEDLVSHLIDSGVHGITLFGSTGEFAYLNQEQKEDILKIVLRINNKRVPIIAGVSHFSTLEAIKQAKKFEELGVDGILTAINIYFPLDQESIYSYFKTIAQNVHCPIVIYHNPKFSNIDFSFDLIIKLSRINNINYIKYATIDTGKVLSIIEKAKKNIKVFSASANNPLLMLMFGAVGWMAGPACVIPKQSVSLYNLVKGKKWEEAIVLQKKINKINELFQKYNLAACIKAALEIQGFDIGKPILPQQPLSVDAKKEIQKALKVYLADF